jgi:uncharacterized membrane protein SpoIIM required for sporulation
MAAKSGVKDQQSVLKIVISLMFVAMGVEGFVKGKSGQAAKRVTVLSLSSAR